MIQLGPPDVRVRQSGRCDRTDCGSMVSSTELQRHKVTLFEGSSWSQVPIFAFLRCVVQTESPTPTAVR